MVFTAGRPELGLPAVQELVNHVTVLCQPGFRVPELPSEMQGCVALLEGSSCRSAQADEVRGRVVHPQSIRRHRHAAAGPVGGRDLHLDGIAVDKGEGVVGELLSVQVGDVPLWVSVDEDGQTVEGHLGLRVTEAAPGCCQAGRF